MKLILLGNAGAGKSTMARRIIGDEPIPHLSLDKIAWDDRDQPERGGWAAALSLAYAPKRKPLEVSLRMLHAFIQSNEQWIVEGCYSDLIRAALPYCTELRFLNPGIEVCVAHCHRRPWEPEKFSSPEDQAAMLTRLVQWVREYETREDEYGLRRHRQVFEQFAGRKREYTSVECYPDG
jgi:adenylate kinase family enzyme